MVQLCIPQHCMQQCRSIPVTDSQGLGLGIDASGVCSSYQEEISISQWPPEQLTPVKDHVVWRHSIIKQERHGIPLQDMLARDWWSFIIKCPPQPA